MTLADIVKQSRKFTIDNSPLILTAIGVTGVVTTGVLTAVATSKSIHALELKYDEAWDEIPLRKEDVPDVWKYWIPPVIVGTGTIACVVGANRIGTRRAAALAVAYGLSEKAFAEYKDKVVEKIGEKKERQVVDAVQQDRIDRNPPSNEVIIAGNGEVLCYDSFAGRYFKSDMETIRKAENEVNKLILDEGYASLTEFYDRVGLSATQFSEEVGFTYDLMLEIVYSSCLSEDGKPCIAISYRNTPVRNYFRNNR